MFVNYNTKGFTLLELLIVIAIIAILAAVVMIALNPAELLRRSRDATRINDVDTMRNAISAYIFDQNAVSTFTLTFGTAASGKCIDGATPTMYFSLTAVGTAGAYFGPPLSTKGYTAVATSTTPLKTDGTGWVPVNFNAITLGIKLPTLPTDPINTSTTGGSLYYTYSCRGTDNSFGLTANMESAAFKQGGDSDKESKDGGPSLNIYEGGTNLLSTSTTAAPLPTTTGAAWYVLP